MSRPKIGIIVGSKSDLPKLEELLSLLKDLEISYSLDIISAHREPHRLRRRCKEWKDKREVIIAAAGLSAALPGFIASYVDIPVIGVPLEGGMLDGLDSLLSIVQVPKGIGLVSTGVGKKGLVNALIFAVKILALKDKEYQNKLKVLKRRFKH